MATSAGAIQNNGQITWWRNDFSIGKTTSAITLAVDAYYKQIAPYYQQYNGNKSWSGSWGSGSAAQAYFLNAGQSIRIVTSSRSVTLTDSSQSFSFVVTARHYFGNTGSTWNISVGPRYARTPGTLLVTRESDTSHRLNWSRTSTYTSVIVQRSTDNKTWQQVGRPTGNAYTFTDKTTKPNQRYYYRVAGVGGAGQSNFTPSSAAVYTTPAAVGSVTAVKRDDGSIAVTAGGLPPYADSYSIHDNGASVATGVKSWPWVHASPDPSVTHKYTVYAHRGSLRSAGKDSGVVQLLAPPLAPTNLKPNGGIAVLDEDAALSWTHNPVDTTAQTRAEVEVSPPGSTEWYSHTVTGEASVLPVTLEQGANRWRVRTKGQHADWGPWSPTATVTAISRPAVAMIGTGLVDTPVYTAEWTWTQAEGRPQSAWRVQLLDADGEILEDREGTGATSSYTFAYRLADRSEYTVRARAATGGVWSDWAPLDLEARFLPPVDAAFDAVWDETTGSVAINVGQAFNPDHAPVVNHFTNPNFKGEDNWMEWGRNLWKNSLLSAASPSLVGTNGVTAKAQIDDGVRFSVIGDRPGETVSFVYTSGAHRVPVDMGSVYSMQIPIRNSGGNVITLQVYAWMNRDTGGNATQHSQIVTLQPGEEIDVKFENVMAPDGAVDWRFSFWWSGTGGAPRPPVGSMFDVLDGLAVWKNPTSLGRATEGLSPIRHMRARFEGAVNASDVIVEGDTIGFVSHSNVILFAGEYEGKSAAWMFPYATSTNSFAKFTVPVGSLRDGGTLVGTRVLEAPLRPPVDKNRQGVLAYYGANREVWQSPAQANEAGVYEHRLEYGKLTESFQYGFGHGGGEGSGDVLWTSFGLFEPGYTGPAFAGDTGFVDIEGSRMVTEWVGPPDASPSRAVMPPLAVAVEVERSVDGGNTWEIVLEYTSVAEGAIATMDRQSLSNGLMLYRVTTFSNSGAASVKIHSLLIESGSTFLSGGDSLEFAARLPYNPEVDLEQGRARSVKRYMHQPYGVAYSGRQLERRFTIEGRVRDGDPDVIGVDDLGAIAQLAAPVFMYRDPDGRRVYVGISNVRIKRWRGGWWDFSIDLEEVSKGGL